MNKLTSPEKRLSKESGELLALLAFIYLQNNRPESAAVLLRAVSESGLGDDTTRGALALALLRGGLAESAFATLESIPLRKRLSPAFQLLRAQILNALERPGEAALAMQAYVDSRTDSLRDMPSDVRPPR